MEESRFRLPLHEPQLGQPRLRLPSRAARRPIRLLRGIELAEKALQLGLPIQREADSGPVVRLGEALPGLLSLVERIPPGPLQLKDLRAVHETPAGERLQIGLPVAPTGQRRGPFPSTATS